MDKILAAAQTIATARRNRAPLAALPPELAYRADEAEGYRIQRAVHDLLLPIPARWSVTRSAAPAR